MNIDIKKIRPLSEWVFLEADTEEITPSGLIVPSTDRYPTTGTVVAVGRKVSDIVPGDYVVVPDEGTYQGHVYWQVCYITFKDHPEKVYCDFEVEVVLREFVEKYRANPSTEDRTIVVKTHDGDEVSFLCSDVKDYGLEEINSPDWKLEYVPTVHVRLWHDGKERLFYFVRVEEILLIVK